MKFKDRIKNIDVSQLPPMQPLYSEKEARERRCKFTPSDLCKIRHTFKREPTELECIACSIRSFRTR